VSATDLFDQTVTVHHMEVDTDDPYGNGGVVETGTTDYLGWLTQLTSVELTENRDTAVADWELSLPPSAAIDFNDQVTDALGRRFEVVGLAAEAHVPWGGVSHLVAHLRHVSGT
jgi:hypothetical protein